VGGLEARGGVGADAGGGVGVEEGGGVGVKLGFCRICCFWDLSWVRRVKRRLRSEREDIPTLPVRIK
jgi:hypothetical protein